MSTLPSQYTHDRAYKHDVFECPKCRPAGKAKHLSVTDIASELDQLRQSLPEISDEETRGPLAAAVLSR
ncbi:MAG: hypothetical protein ABIU05_09095 [Nitrospirales bacterium]